MNSRKTLYVDETTGNLIIGGISATDLRKKYGTPLYVFDKQYIEDVCNAFVQTVENEYDSYGRILYASKAFSAKGIYNIIDNLNLGADVVSIGELYTALSSGFSAEKLVFHGNNKLYNELEYAIKSNVKLIVADSLTELDDINEIAKKFNKSQDVLLRVNPGVEAHTHEFVQTATPDSKFGFSLSKGDAFNAIKHALTKNNVNLKGLHCHIGSQIFEKEAFSLAVNKMTDYYEYIKRELNFDFDVLNLGGGFGIYYTDEDVKMTVNDYTQYVKTIIQTLKSDIEKKNIKKPYLLLEPGRSIVGEAGITLYTVGRIKEIEGIKNYISVDGGMFDNPRYALYGSKYTTILAEKGNLEPIKAYTVAGKCCESGDIITTNQLLPEVKEGDLLAVFSTGAYNYSMASNYNRNFIPPVVIVKDGKSDYLVKPQTLEDIVRNDNDSVNID